MSTATAESVKHTAECGRYELFRARKKRRRSKSKKQKENTQHTQAKAKRAQPSKRQKPPKTKKKKKKTKRKKKAWRAMQCRNLAKVSARTGFANNRLGNFSGLVPELLVKPGAANSKACPPFGGARGNFRTKTPLRTCLGTLSSPTQAQPCFWRQMWIVCDDTNKKALGQAKIDDSALSCPRLETTPLTVLS